MSREYRVAVVGATGMVGNAMREILEERDFPVAELRLLASERSRGKMLPFRGEEVEVQVLDKDSFLGIDLALQSLAIVLRTQHQRLTKGLRLQFGLQLRTPRQQLRPTRRRTDSHVAAQHPGDQHCQQPKAAVLGNHFHLSIGAVALV